MENFDNIINWDAFKKNSDIFKKNKPCKWVFIENVFHQDFYDKLYNTYPQWDKTWDNPSDYARSSQQKMIGIPYDYVDKENPEFSKEWNKLIRYTATEEFRKNLSDFTGWDIQKTEYMSFMNSHKGDFSLPHLDGFKDCNGNTTFRLQMMFYFCKGWQKGDPGGTYVSDGEDESKIIFEPYNLDNSMMCFDVTSPDAWHGSRYIIKDVRRQALSIRVL
jgi:hypothetical protein